MKDIQVYMDYIEKSKTELTEEVEQINADLQTISGPFTQEFNAVLDDMHLKHQVYHSGALIGNYVKKTFQPENIEKLANIFQPSQIETDEGLQTFGSVPGPQSTVSSSGLGSLQRCIHPGRNEGTTLELIHHISVSFEQVDKVRSLSPKFTHCYKVC